MTTLAVNFSIDVTKLDRERFYTGKNGAKYANLTCWITPDEPNQYGQHGGIKEQTTKEDFNSIISKFNDDDFDYIVQHELLLAWKYGEYLALFLIAIVHVFLRNMSQW